LRVDPNRHSVTSIDSVLLDLQRAAGRVHLKPAFKDAAAGQRCLVVTNGFYEWKKLDPKGKLEQAYAVGISDDSEMGWLVCGRRGTIRPTAKTSRAAPC
jgi:hypothetical protein